MDAILLGSLALLALIDSTSFGTLLIPVWLLLAPGRLRPGRVLVFLGNVAAFYLGAGLLLMGGAAAFLREGSGVLDSTPGAVAQLVVGVALFVWSFFLGRKKKATAGPSRLSRWRDRAVGSDDASVAALAGLALAAATVELATMLPYLAAIGLLTTSDLGAPARLALLAAYCVVMVLPALVLLTLRVVARERIEPALRRFAAWMERSAGETTAWIVGIVGFFVARDALVRIPGLIAFLDSL